MKFLFLGCLFLIQTAFAITISDERGRVSLSIPAGWKQEEKILGLPHVLLSHESPVKSSLSITLTGLEGVNLVVKDLKANQKHYQNGRKKWAERRHIKILDFLPYKVIEGKNKLKIHEIGMNYQLKSQNYLEKSFYVECPHTFIHLKLVALKSSPKIAEAEAMVNELVCHTTAK